MQTFTLTVPDDAHLHVRDGAALSHVVPFTARVFRRAIIMPNLKPPVTTVAEALAYRERVLAAVPEGFPFEPWMTLYLTEQTTAQEIEFAAKTPGVAGVKFYPQGATTHAEAGVSEIERCSEALSAMAAMGLPLLIHGEVVDADVDVFDREKVFIDRILKPILMKFPTLKVVLEHITTKEAVSFIQSIDHPIAATITAHHLLLNRNAMFQGGICPHAYCLPVLKREKHREALLEAATSGHPRFFLGTDSAPHGRLKKESACGCAGIFTAHAALPLYAEAFDQVGKLDRLEPFSSHFAADFYGWPRSTDTLTLEKTPWPVPPQYSFVEADVLVPFRAGSPVSWRVVYP